MSLSTPKISVLVPSRNREQQFNKLIKNIYETVSDLNNIELLVKLDNDSLYTLNSKDVFLKSFVSERSESLNRDYYNFLAKEARGQFLFGIGDDVKFLTKNWDKVLIEKIEAFLINKSDRIAYVSVNEKGSKATHPCFPLITREAFELLGEYHCSKLLSWGSDRILWEIYSHPSINRTLHISDINIEHLSYHDGKAPYDETARSMKERFFRDPNCHNLISLYGVPQYRKRIENYIKEFNKNE